MRGTSRRGCQGEVISMACDQGEINGGDEAKFLPWCGF